MITIDTCARALAMFWGDAGSWEYKAHTLLMEELLQSVFLLLVAAAMVYVIHLWRGDRGQWLWYVMLVLFAGSACVFAGRATVMYGDGKGVAITRCAAMLEPKTGRFTYDLLPVCPLCGHGMKETETGTSP